MDTYLTHIPQFDERISLAYRNNAFIADQVMPIVSTEKLRGFYQHFSKQALRSVVDDLDIGGYPRRYVISQEPPGYYQAVGHGVETVAQDDERGEADNPAIYDIIRREFVQGLIALGRELEVANLINSTNIPNNTTLTGTAQWSNDASNPLKAIRAQIRTIQKNVPGSTRENMRLLLPGPVFDAVVDNATVRAYIQYTQNIMDRAVEPSELAAALKIGGVVIAEDIELTSAEGQPDALSFIWPSTAGASIALLYFTTGAPSPLTPNFGYIFRPRAGYFPLREVRDEHGRFTVMISEEKRDTIMTEPNAAFLWNNPI